MVIKALNQGGETIFPGSLCVECFPVGLGLASDHERVLDHRSRLGESWVVSGLTSHDWSWCWTSFFFPWCMCWHALVVHNFKSYITPSAITNHISPLNLHHPIDDLDNADDWRKIDTKNRIMLNHGQIWHGWRQNSSHIYHSRLGQWHEMLLVSPTCDTLSHMQDRWTLLINTSINNIDPNHDCYETITKIFVCWVAQNHGTTSVFPETNGLRGYFPHDGS